DCDLFHEISLLNWNQILLFEAGVNHEGLEAHRGRDLTAKDPARRSRNQNSEYLPQRRKGRKEIKLPDLAFLASWREQIPLFWIATGHRKICARRKNF